MSTTKQAGAWGCLGSVLAAVVTGIVTLTVEAMRNPQLSTGAAGRYAEGAGPTDTAARAVVAEAPGAAEPGPVPVPAPAGQVFRLWAEHNVASENGPGMVVHVGLTAANVRGVPCSAVVYFAYAGGVPLGDADGLYATGDRTVAAAAAFTPEWDDARFEDVRVFIPYTQLHMAPGAGYALQFHVAVFVQGAAGPFAISPPQAFTFTT